MQASQHCSGNLKALEIDVVRKLPWHRYDREPGRFSRLHLLLLPLLLLIILWQPDLPIAASAYASASGSQGGTVGGVWGWGNNSQGQLGTLPSYANSLPIQLNSLQGVIAIAAGGQHMLALTSSGAVYAWGNGTYGQIGDDSAASPVVHPIQVLDLTNVVALAAGRNHSVALESNGTVWAWGDNSYGQTGPYTEQDCYDASFNAYRCNVLPVQLRSLNGITAIAAGGDFSLALKSDGTVWAWGDNFYGELGDGNTTSSGVPVQVSNLTDVVAITAGGSHGLALKSDGTVWAWGQDDYGQLGTAATQHCQAYSRSTVPVQVSGLAGITSIAAGGQEGSGEQSFAIKADGTIWAWGANNAGQLGTGAVSAIGCQCITIPTQVQGLTNAVSVAVGDEHTLALTSDGTVWGWGGNSYGQLGNGSRSDSPIPVPVTGLSNTITIAAGELYSAALTGAVADAVASVNPGSVAYSDQVVSTSSAAQTIAIRNSGNQPVILNGVTLTGPNANDFTILSNTCVSTAIAVPNTSCTLDIRFVPTAIGRRMATLNVSDSASDTLQSVALSGNGITAGGECGDSPCDNGGGATATPELGSSELLATGLLPILSILLYRRRVERRRAQRHELPVE